MSEANQADILAAALAAASRVTVISGAPDEEEVAALVAGLAAIAGGEDPHEDNIVGRSQWENRHRTLSGPTELPKGSDQWRWSLRA
ncbi:acyl-CoA carboxylase epsilon subunit [Populibacterium corticicola]|uniref:Acyl-CoA carboxylase epsilon subunit n=1 Tax=Populibacterium corticicola TaxID=1812826 RepID=A0ABW5XGU4_9MICO